MPKRSGLAVAKRSLSIGIVCPYSFDAPGGVQFHVRDLAQALTADGHRVSVLAPADEETAVPPNVTSAGKAVAIRYNGSVARLSFGPIMAARVRKWLEAGNFDVVHLHEPFLPSLGLLALWESESPVVATYHSSLVRSRALQVTFPFMRRSLETISARIAVSEDARRMLVDHMGGDAIVIPNGVYVDYFADAAPIAKWQGTPSAPTIAFLGRLDEPRKGLQVLAAAIPKVLQEIPGAKFLIAGKGDEGEALARETLGPLANSVEFLGPISDEEKAALLKSVDVYVAPQTGGESFGIVLVEAMSAGAAVVASDLGAFRRVLAEGQAGLLFETGSSDALAKAILDALTDEAATADRRAFATDWVRQYDWSVVTRQIEAVYELAVETREAIRPDDATVPLRNPAARLWTTITGGDIHRTSNGQRDD